MKVWLGGGIVALFLSAAAIAQGSVNWSILPNARTGAPNEDITFFATIVNGTDVEMDCQPRFGGLFARPGGVQGQARFFTFDGENVGDTFNQVVSIPAGGRQDYVVALNVNRSFSGPVNIPLACTDPDDILINLERIPAVNDFNLVIENGNPPDIIMVSDTVSRDGVARVGETGPRTALMTVAAINIGGDATNVTVFPRISGFTALQDGFAPTICRTDASGVCLTEEGPSARVALWGDQDLEFFAVRTRVAPELGVPFYPDVLRMEVGVTRDNFDFTHIPVDGIDLLARTSVATEVRRQIAPLIDLSNVQQCIFDQPGDVGRSFSREGGMVVFDENFNPNGNLLGFGYFRQSQNQFDSRFQDMTPFSLSLPPGNTGNTQILVNGMGSGTAQSSDDVANVTVTDDGNGNIQLSWNSNPGFSNDFEVPGRIRCAAAPRLPGAPRVGVESALSGVYAIDQAAAAIANPPPLTIDDAGRDDGFMGLDADPATNVADALLTFLGGFGAVGSSLEMGAEASSAQPGDPAFGFYIPSRYDRIDGSDAVVCGTVMVVGNPNNEASEQGRDANVFVFRREGAEIQNIERECVR